MASNSDFASPKCTPVVGGKEHCQDFPCQSALEWDPPYCRTKQCYPGVIGWAQAER